MKITKALLAGVFVVFSVGCATVPSNGGGTPGDSGGGVMTGKDHVSATQVGHFDCKVAKPEHKLPLSIFIDATEEGKVHFPESIGLCMKKTDLVWVAFGASNLEITYKPTVANPKPRPAKLAEANAPCYKMLDAAGQSMGVSCVLNKSSHIDYGSISYDIAIVTKDNVPIKIDPQLIIQK